MKMKTTTADGMEEAILPTAGASDAARPRRRVGLRVLAAALAVAVAMVIFAAVTLVSHVAGHAFVLL